MTKKKKEEEEENDYYPGMFSTLEFFSHCFIISFFPKRKNNIYILLSGRDP